MKRFITFASAVVLTLGLAVSAQAVNIIMPDGVTANTVIGGINGVDFVSNPSQIAAILNENTSTKYDLHVLSSFADFKNTLGDRNGNSFTYQSNTGFDLNTGMYRYNTKIKEDVLLSDVYVKSTGPQGAGTIIKGVTNLADYDTSYYATPPSKAGSHTAAKYQMYIVSDYSVEINGNTFYQGSIIIAFDDGGYRHTDFNDLVFVFGAQAPPAVPIPGVAFLLAPGLAGLAVLRRKMK